MCCCSPSPPKVSSWSTSSFPLSPTVLSFSGLLWPLLSCVAPFHLLSFSLLFFLFALFQNFSTPLTLHPLRFRLSPLPSPSSASRIDGLSAKFTSSVSLCSTRDTERWSRQFCFLSLPCVATCIAELAGVDVSLCGSSPPPCRTLK